MPARILVIEDNQTNLELILYLLQAFGHETHFTADGREAIAMAINTEPDLILCDIQLPGLSGFDIARLAKASSSLRRIPLIAITALAMVGDRSRIIEAGFDGYIPKPIEPQTLLRELDGFLPPHLHSLVRPAPGRLHAL